MTIQELNERINKDSTIMDAGRELFYFQQLISLPREEILQSWGTFNEILDRLTESHTQVFFEVEKFNRQKFIEFADWLVELGKAVNDSGVEEGLTEIANTFRIDPEEVFGKRADTGSA